MWITNLHLEKIAISLIIVGSLVGYGVSKALNYINVEVSIIKESK